LLPGSVVFNRTPVYLHEFQMLEIRSGAAMPVNSDGTTCVLDTSGNLKSSALTDACFGGSARRKQFISEFKAANPRTIALDGGSAFWGSFMCTN
jgi:hypothetical protein